MFQYLIFGHLANSQIKSIIKKISTPDKDNKQVDFTKILEKDIIQEKYKFM